METTSIHGLTVTHRRITESAESQISMSPSADPLASRPPSSTAKDHTEPSCPSSVATHAPVARSHIRFVGLCKPGTLRLRAVPRPGRPDVECRKCRSRKRRKKGTTPEKPVGRLARKSKVPKNDAYLRKTREWLRHFYGGSASAQARGFSSPAAGG